MYFNCYKNIKVLIKDIEFKIKNDIYSWNNGVKYLVN